MSGRDEPVDLLVIGAGMAGGAISKLCAEAGLRVTCLEQGPWTAADEYPHADPLYELRRQQDWNTAGNLRQAPDDYPVRSDRVNPLMRNGVGGSTVHYTAAWPRFRPSDFRRGSEHGLGPDWPLTYEDLAPYYAHNDREMGVSGVAGDPAYPPREPRQTPPVPLGATGRRAAEGFDSLGWHWWPFDVAIVSRDYDGRLACNHCGNCQSGCQRGSLASTANTYWPKALAAGAQLRTRCHVEQILTDAGGRAIGAVYLDAETGRRDVQHAARTVVCANGIGTPRLLLLSASGRHPNGLANDSDQVGRNLMHHGLAIVEMWTDEVLEAHKGVVCGAIYSAEFAETDPSRGFVNGLTMVICRQNGPGFQALGSHAGHRAPWGEAHHAWFRDHFDRGFCVLIQTEDLPVPGNRVTLDDEATDPYGLPAPRLTYTLQPNDRRLIDFGIDRALDLSRAVGAIDTKVNRFEDEDGVYGGPAWHLMGTARLGADPETSVTDPWHRAWDVPNLLVCDGSSLPTGGQVNPTSTIGALAVRCARGIVADARRQTLTQSGPTAAWAA